jgi:hypothetical protein
MAATPVRKLRAAVVAFEDLTPESGHRKGDVSDLLPCMLYVPFWTRRLSETEGPAPVPPECLEHWLAADLQASGLFENAVSVPWHEIVGHERDYDLVITGRFLGDRREGRSFCLMGPLMVLFQVIPLIPGGSMERVVTFEVEAVDPRRPEEPVWSRLVSARDPRSGTFSITDRYAQKKFSASTAALYRLGFEDVRRGLLEALSPGGALDRWSEKRR